MARAWLRDPLLHFLVLGAALFALQAAVDHSAFRAPDEIVVDDARLAVLVASFEQVWQRPPTAAERRGLVEGWVREEILYREGLALGMDRDDPVVRRRIAQRMDFLAEAAVPARPGDADLAAWLAAHPEDYRIESVYSLRQLYFDPARRGERLDADLAAARAALAAGAAASADVTPLPDALDGAPASEVARVFGTGFAAALDALPVGGWQGPVRSGYGLHLVELRARTPGRPAALDEVRADVERDWLRDRSEAANRAFYESLRSRYSVRIDADPTPLDDARGGGK